MKNKDWIGNYNSIYKTIGASNHTEEEREKNDYYATDPKAIEHLLKREKFSNVVWECACGEGHMSDALKQGGYSVHSTDLVDRGYEGTEIIDFLTYNSKNALDIITNPPYKYAKEFVEHALDISADGVKVAMFLKLTFLEGKARKKLFEIHPPKTVYVFSNRIKCAKNGNFAETGSSAVAYAWFVWEKGFNGKPTIEWI